MFEAGGNMEAAALEKDELALIEEYLPAMADEATVRATLTYVYIYIHVCMYI